MEQTPICPARLEKLLVCTDGSADSQGALSGTLALAQSCGSKIFALQVLEFNPELEAQAPEFIAQREAKVHDYLKMCKAEAEKLEVPIETRVRRSEAAYVGIVEEAEKIKPDLIIMGRRGRGRLFRLMMGNVTARVIGYSPFNVLVVPKGVLLEFKRILIASDGSPHSYAAWDEALFMTQRVGADLIALSVARDERDLPTAQAIVGRLQKEAASQGIKVKALVLEGRPFEAIVQAARDEKVDLIVMGTLGMTELKSLLMGSTTERVIAQAPCSVMVVKRLM
ncbi:MAG: universal stress protein [Desulfobaccales bacterium]|nr:universal stress protein [Desulfobaccales bacterium]